MGSRRPVPSRALHPYSICDAITVAGMWSPPSSGGVYEVGTCSQPYAQHLFWTLSRLLVSRDDDTVGSFSLGALDRIAIAAEVEVLLFCKRPQHFRNEIGRAHV